MGIPAQDSDNTAGLFVGGAIYMIVVIYFGVNQRSGILFRKTKSHKPVTFTGFSDLMVFCNHQITRTLKIKKNSHKAKKSQVCDFLK